jgi:uncharacterized protein (DUF736 family)
MSTDNKSDWKRREVGALWKKTSASGKTYLTGNLTLSENGVSITKRVVLFDNTNKKSDSAPDANIYLSEDSNGSNGSAGSAGSGGNAATGPAKKPAQSTSGPSSGPASTGPKRTVAPKNTDDIPFGME